MQRLKVCRKLMAFVLTLCMVLPLISNQYLVVRAEALSQISSLKNSCQEIDMTQQKKVTLEKQQYSDTQYQYAISGWYESTPRYGTDNGVLYKIKLDAGQAVQIKKSDNYIYGNGCYWYGAETIDQYTDSGMATYQNNGSESVSVYCWVVKDQDSDSTFSLTIESGQKVTDLSDKAFDIKETLELKKTAGNYVENLISGSSMLNGWLYKTSNEEKVYSINNLDKMQIISVDLFNEFGSKQQSVHLMAEDYTDGYDTTGDETSNQLTISENISYVFLIDNDRMDNLILQVGKAKKLSEIQNINSLTENTTKEYAEDDKVVTLANEKCYLYKFEVPANSMIGLTVEVDNYNYTSDFFFVYGEDGTIEGSKTDTGAIINNVSDTSKTYYVGVKKSVTTYGNKFKLSYESVNQLKDCTPVELNEEQPEFTVSKLDERIKTVAKMDQNGSWQIASGILLKVIIPKKSTVSLNNNSFMYYPDLSQSAYPYYNDYNFSKLNDTDEEEAIYIFASVGETWKMTVTHDSDSKVPDLAELSPLSISEGTTTIDQTQAKLTNVKVKNYTDEDGNPITSIMQEGILYKYDIPAHMNATINMGIAELDGSYGWLDVYENLDDYPITSICANYGDTPKTVYIWAVPDSVDGVENPTYQITIKNTSNQYTYTTPYDEEVENLSEIQDVYIYSWNTELGDRLDSFFGSHPEYVDKVHFVNKECDATDSNYYDFVNGELSKNDSVIAAFDRDTMTQEMISNSNIVPVSTIGVLKDENLATYYTKNAYDYTVKDGSSADGTLKMVSDSVYPGCFMYNKAVAMDVLGTDDPDEVQKYINDWDGFYAVAEKAKTAGYTMTSGSDQVIKDKLNRSDIYNELLTKGYETGHKTWDDEWYADRNSGKIFGFFADPSMLWMLEDSQLDKYDMCIAPCAYVYGGVYYASNNACKDNPLVAQILYTLTCDADAMGAVCKSGNGDMVNNQAAVKQQAVDKTPIDRYMGDDASLWKRWDTYAARVGNDAWLANKLSYGNYAVKVDATNSFSISEIGNGFDSRFLEPITISVANNVKAVTGTGNNTVVTVYDTDHVVKYNYTIGSTTYTLQFAPYKEDTITASIVENETQLESGAMLVQSVTLENGGITGKQAETIYGTSENQVVLTEAKDGTGTVVKEADVAVKQNSLDSDTVKTAMDVVEQKNAEYNGDKYTNASIGEVNAVFSDDADKNVTNAVFDSLKKQNIKLTLSKETNTGNEYTWTFESADISEPVSLKTGIKVETLDETIKTLIPEDKDDCMFDFAQEGILPGKATVAVNVADLNLSSDESLYCYYYDEDKGELLEGQPVTVDENGNVAIEIEHCCKYVVTSAKIAKLVNKVEIVVPESKVLNVGDTLNLSATITPETATNKSITWTSGDDAIATVDESTGMVTAKSTGTVTIKATAKDGSKKFDEIELSIVAKECKHEKTEVRNAKEASCTEAGYTGDTYCVDCDAKLATGEVIAKKEHTSSDWIVDKAATVEAEGSRHKECTVCKTVLAKEAIAKLPAPTPTPEPVVTPDVTIRYTTHVQTFGWQGDENNASKWFVNGKMAGTSGKAKRLEGIKIRVYGNDNLGIQYTTHCQSYGWLPWSANGEMNGTEGEAKRLEAIKIQLTGTDKDKYDVYYRVHAQSYGWLGWAKNGAPSGTAGYAKRLEGIQVVVVKKGAAAPGLNYAGVNAASGVHQTASYVAKAGSSPVVGNQATSNTNPSVAGEANVNVAYRTHVQTFGWQGWKYNGQMSGTSGQAKRLEGINIKLTNKPYSGSIVYTTHVQTYGWQGNENNPNTWKRDGDMSGTSGEAKRLEAIRIALTGEMAEHYDVYYRVHAQSFGWLGWAKNGEAAGTAGLAKRLEGIQIVLVPKGGNAPARSYQGIMSVKTQAYIKK